MQTTRREFIKNTSTVATCLCAGLVGLSGCSILDSASSTPVVPHNSWIITGDDLVISIDQVPELKAPGGSGKISFNDPVSGDKNQIIIIHSTEGEYKAFADCCTHGCKELNYLHEDSWLQCSSFGKSTFSLDGSVVKGPAKETLKSYSLIKKEDKIVINLP